MSGIRKIRRVMTLLKMWEETSTGVTPLDILLSIGLILLVSGIMAGGIGYFYYTGGRPEMVINSQFGTDHISKKPSGDPKYKEIAKICAIAATVGFILLTGVLLTRLVLKEIQPPGSGKDKTDGRWKSDEG